MGGRGNEASLADEAVAVARASARHLAEHEGVVYAFCSIGCRTRFMKDPTAFLAAPGTHSMEAT